MRVVVTVTERFEEARELVGHDLSGPYVIHMPDDKDADNATTEAIALCRELLAIEDDELFEMIGHVLQD